MKRKKTYRKMMAIELGFVCETSSERAVNSPLAASCEEAAVIVSLPGCVWPGWWPCKTDLSGSKMAKMIDERAVTRNWGMTMNML